MDCVIKLLWFGQYLIVYAFSDTYKAWLIGWVQVYDNHSLSHCMLTGAAWSIVHSEGEDVDIDTLLF